MTTHTNPSRRPANERAAGGYINRDHTVTGTPDQLANLVANHRNAGTLVAMTAPRPVTDDRFQVIIRIREPRPTTPATPASEFIRTRTRRPRRIRPAVIATTAAGTVAGLLAAAAYLLGQLVEFIAAHAALIIGALVVIALLALAGLLRTSGRHCPGC